MTRRLGFLPPPRVLPSDTLRWVLSKSFQRDGKVSGLVPAADDAVRIAAQLDLSARLAVALGDHLLEELGQPAGRTLSQRRLAVEASNALLLASLAELVRTAQELGTPVALLKFCALSSSGLIARGTRDARDIDVLIPQEHAVQLHDRLRKSGFRPLTPAPEDPLCPLVGQNCEVIEIHREIPGIAILPSKHAATFEELWDAGLLDPVVQPAGAFTPRREVLIAHALVHGLEQHGVSPRSYPAFRYLCDLVDLLRGPVDDLALAESCRKFVLNEGTRFYVQAAIRLARLLRDGPDPFATHPESDESMLFRHALAASCDPLYRHALKLSRFEKIRARHGLSAALRRTLGSPGSSTKSRTAMVGLAALLSGASATRELAFVARSWLLLRRRGPLRV